MPTKNVLWKSLILGAVIWKEKNRPQSFRYIGPEEVVKDRRQISLLILSEFKQID